MIQQQAFRKLRIYDYLILGLSAVLMVQKRNGTFLETTRRGNFKIINEANVKRLVLTSAYTLTEEDNGSIVEFGSATGFTVTLPLLAGGGWAFKFLVGTQPTSGNHVVVAQSTEQDTINGRIVDMAGTGDVVASNDQINFVASQAAVGDFVDVYSHDAEKWWAEGVASVAAGVTATG